MLRIYCIIFVCSLLYVKRTSSLIGTRGVDRLNNALTQLCTDELHHTAFSHMFDNTSVRYTPAQTDGDKEVKDLSQKIAVKIKSVVSVVDNNGKIMEDSYTLSEQLNQLFNSEDCCKLNYQTKYNARYKEDVNESITCSRLFSSNSKNRMAPSFIADFERNSRNNPGMTWQYSGDIYGAYHQYPASNNTCKGSNSADDDFRYRSWYVNTVTPKKKNIVIVLDESGTMSIPDDWRNPSITRIERAKEAAHAVLDTLSARDWGGVVAFSDLARSPPGCYGDEIAQANSKNKQEFDDFIKTLKPLQSTSYSVALEKAFALFEEAQIKNKTNQFDDSMDIIIFLTDGDPTDKPDKIRKVIADGNNKLNNKVRIFFYGLGNNIGQNTDMSDLLSFADQNNGVLNIQHLDRQTRQTNTYNAAKWNNIGNKVGPTGHFEVISSKNAHRLRDVMASYYLNYPQSISRQPSFTIPFVDQDHGLTVTVTKPLLDSNHKPFGVTAVDTQFDSLFDDITYYRRGQYSYALLVTREGKVLSHRNFARPSKARPNVNFVSLDIAEPSLSKLTRKDIIDGKSGSEKEQVTLAMSRGVSRQDGSYKVTMNATYHYQPVPGFEKDYSVVIVMFDADTNSLQRQPSKTSIKSNSKTLASYHRALDPAHSANTNQDPNICVTKQQALIDKKRSTIKLAANAFINPNKYLTEVATTHDVKTIEKLLKDQVSKPNTILKTETLEDIIYTRGFESVLGSSAQSQAVSNYMATLDGVFRISPGMLMEKYYNPAEQPWYKQSSVYQDKCVYTRAGYSPSGDESLLSMSQALLDPQKNMIGSVGADLSLSYIRSLLHTNIPECNSQQWSCTLLDHSGYVMTEGAKSKSATDQSLTHFHVSDVYPEVINDIILRHQVIELKWCRRLHGSMQSQMFYTISSAYDKVSSDPGAAACENYRLHNLKGSNLHLLITSALSCAPQGNTQQSCQCNSKCTVCNTTKATCQCPCTCDAGADPCTNRYDVVFPPITCPAPWIPVKPSKMNQQNTPALPCPTDCHQKQNKSHCLSDSKCQWCTAGPTPACLRSCPRPAPDTTTTSITTPTSPITVMSSQSVSKSSSQGAGSLTATPSGAGGTPGKPPHLVTQSSGKKGSTVPVGSSLVPGGAPTKPAVSSSPQQPPAASSGGASTQTTIPGPHQPTQSGTQPTHSGAQTTQVGPNTPQGNSAGNNRPNSSPGNPSGNTSPSGNRGTTKRNSYGNSAATQKPLRGCEATMNLHPVTVLMKEIQPAPVCQIDYDKFCAKHCSPPAPVIQTCKQTSEKDADDNYTKLAAGLGVPLAALAALSAIALFALLRKKSPIPLETPTKIRPVEPFVPNIYRASMGDTSLPTVGKRGATLDDWNSNGQAMFGRVSISE